MLKRIFDLFAAITLLVVFMPVIIMVGILVRLFLGSPVLFTQIRPGLKGKPFKVYKFRSMIDKRDAKGALLPDQQRTTKFSHALRKTSVDELPQLFNVLKGELSLVGPRPLLMEYLPLYNDEQARRHDVKPGITGWAQVNGRNAISWEEKFKLDVWYADNCSFWLDLKILLLTVKKVLMKSDINSSIEIPMPYFTGSKNVKK
jgi:sugar transferase EpsL